MSGYSPAAINSEADRRSICEDGTDTARRNASFALPSALPTLIDARYPSGRRFIGNACLSHKGGRDYGVSPGAVHGSESETILIHAGEALQTAVVDDRRLVPGSLTLRHAEPTLRDIAALAAISFPEVNSGKRNPPGGAW